MDNSFGNANQPNTQRPLLKKVKRPINRIMPQTPHNPSVNVEQNSVENNLNASSKDASQTFSNNPFNQEAINTQPTNEEQNADNANAFDLDAYLDDDTNLPTKNNIPDSFENSNTPHFIEEDELNSENYYAVGNGELPPYLTKKVLILLGCVLFFIGILSGMFLFSEEKVVRNGLQGVVVNPEVPRGRARCGVAERTQGCVLYIMNPQRQELNARDFYDLASQLTGRQRFVIETGNMRYSNTKIRPGNIVQLNIPPL